MRELEISRPLFERLVDRGVDKLARYARSQLATIHEPITVTEIPGRGVRVLAFDPQTMVTPDIPLGNLDIHFCRSRPVFDARIRAIQTGAYKRDGWQSWLVVGTGRLSGRLAAFFKSPKEDEAAAADVVRLVGSGMECIPLRNADLSRVWHGSDQIWSRSQEALGKEVWERAVTSRFLLIGAGRSGSLLAQAIGNLGVRELVILDPDTIEAHNLDGGPLFSVTDLSSAKAEVLARRVEADCPWASVEPVRSAAASEVGIARIKAADVVVAAVDSERSLLQVHALCRIYGRTLLTVGTRIREDGIGLDVAADIGLYYGGQPGCLLCVGGTYAGFHGARRALAQLPETPEQHQRARRAGDFATERRGSLLSLNSMAAGCALYTLQSAFGGGAAWTDRAQITRMFYDENGHLQSRTTRSNQAHTTGECLCSMMNTGDHGLQLLKAYAGRSRMSFSRRWR